MSRGKFRIMVAVAGLFLGRSVLAASNSEVEVSVSSFGLESLKYKGREFLYQPVHDTIMTDATFLTPGSVQKAYGWVASSLGGLSIPISSSSVGCNANPLCVQQVYRSGLPDSFTLQMDWTVARTDTAKVVISITNNDPSDTLQTFGLEYFLYLKTPGPVHFNGDWLTAAPVAMTQGSWGSMVWFTDNYATNANFTDVWTFSPANPTLYLPRLVNYTSPGGAAVNTQIDTIAPGATYTYTLYIRFGSSSETSAHLAPEAYAAYRTAYPYLVNWPNRAPIARWFLGSSAFWGQPSNPRAWNLNAISTNNFSASVLKWTDQVIATMDAMPLRPQGIVIWDLEGDEFYQPFTYVGNPPQLPTIAPEMDAVADQIFSKLTNAGYKVGMTLRPSSFAAGPVLPSTCTYIPQAQSYDANQSDVFVLTSAPYPYQGYVCSAPNTWTQPYAQGPAYQTVSNTDSVTLSWLEAKISYAHSRWGAKLFYIDSTVYATSGGSTGGNTLNFKIFRQLQTDFPDCLFMPENMNTLDWGASAPYSAPGDFGSPLGAGGEITNIYPTAFSSLEDYNQNYISNKTNQKGLAAAAKNGNIFFVDGWFPNSQNNDVQQLYTSAEFPIKPHAPSGVGVSSSSIKWTWPAVKNAASYNVYAATKATSLVASTPMTTFTQVNLSNSKAYGIVIMPVNSKGVPGYLSKSATAYTLAEPPLNPGFAFVWVTSATLRWNANNNPPGTKYVISHWKVNASIRTAANSAPILPKSSDPTHSTWTVTGLMASTSYYFQVRAENERNQLSPQNLDISLATSTKMMEGAGQAHQSLQVAAAKPRTASNPVAVEAALGPAYFGRKLLLASGTDRLTISTRGALLTLSLPAGANGLGRVNIFSAKGVLVQKLSLGLLKGGFVYAAAWDGRDQNGQELPPGRYHAVFWMPGLAETAAARMTIKKI